MRAAAELMVVDRVAAAIKETEEKCKADLLKKIRGSKMDVTERQEFVTKLCSTATNRIDQHDILDISETPGYFHKLSNNSLNKKDIK